MSLKKPFWGLKNSLVPKFYHNFFPETWMSKPEFIPGWSPGGRASIWVEYTGSSCRPESTFLVWIGWPRIGPRAPSGNPCPQASPHDISTTPISRPGTSNIRPPSTRLNPNHPIPPTKNFDLKTIQKINYQKMSRQKLLSRRIRENVSLMIEWPENGRESIAATLEYEKMSAFFEFWGPRWGKEPHVYLNFRCFIESPYRVSRKSS